MTWLGIAAILFILISCVVGFRRGFVKEAVSLMFMVLAMMIVWTINPYVNEFLKEKTPVYTAVQENCQKTISEQLSGEGELGEDVQKALIASLPLPESAKTNMSANNTSEVYQYLAVDTFAEYIADYLAVMITNGISFLLSFLLATVGIRLAAAALHLMAQLPVLRGINRLGGGVIGCLRAVLIIWIAFLVLTVFYSTDIGRQGLRLVEQDPLLKVLYDKDIFVQIFMSIFYGK